MMDKIKLLWVENNFELVLMFKKMLEMSGDYDVRTASNGKEGLESYKSFEPDVIVAGIDMPVMDGREMVHIIRKKDAYTPIIFITNHKEPEDFIKGIEAGADMYIHKPVLPKGVDVQIRSLLKRTSRRLFPPAGNEEWLIGAFVLNIPGKYLIRNGKRTDLTGSEAKILDLLAKNKGQLVKRKEMETTLQQGYEIISARVLDVHIHNLRKKLAKDRSVKIKTVRGEGHILEDGQTSHF